jgi:hypothetical protein
MNNKIIIIIIIIIIFNKLVEEDPVPEWLKAGVTFLIQKNENTENPKNYRPVTCLPTIYKLITSIISSRMQIYMEDENLMPKEEGGCSGTKECKDHLLLSRMILQECKRKKKKLSMAWIIRKLLTGFQIVG